MPSKQNGRDKVGFQTPGMLQIIADVHELVDEHRVRNGQEKWDWNLKNLIDKGVRKFPRTGWIAKLIISNGFHTKTRETNHDSEVYKQRLSDRDSGK